VTDVPAPLSDEELATLQHTLAHEHAPLRSGRAASMPEAIQMQRDGYDTVAIYEGETLRGYISNGGNPRVMWEWGGPRLLATLDAARSPLRRWPSCPTRLRFVWRTNLAVTMAVEATGTTISSRRSTMRGNAPRGGVFVMGDPSLNDGQLRAVADCIRAMRKIPPRDRPEMLAALVHAYISDNGHKALFAQYDDAHAGGADLTR